MIRIAIAAALCLVVAGCKGREQPQGAPAGPEPKPASLVGTWTTDQPVRFSGEGLRTETSQGRTAYAPDRRFDYSGRLTIYGEKLPAGGVSFRIAAKGDWRRERDRLTEDFTQVSLTSEVPNADLDRLADQLEAEMEAAAPSVSDIVALNQRALKLRDRSDGRETTYTRR